MSLRLLDTFTRQTIEGPDWEIRYHRAETGQLWVAETPEKLNFQLYDPANLPTYCAYQYGSATVGPYVAMIDCGFAGEINAKTRAYRGVHSDYGYEKGGLLVRGNGRLSSQGAVDMIALEWERYNPDAVTFYLLQWVNGAVTVHAQLAAAVAWVHNNWKLLRVRLKGNTFQGFLANGDGSGEVQLGGDQYVPNPMADAGHTYVGYIFANAGDTRYDDLMVFAPSIVLAGNVANFSVPQSDPAPAPLAIGATNDGDTPDFGSLAVSVDYHEGAGWCTPTLDGPSTPTNVNIAVDPTGLAVGTYTATLHVSSVEADNSPQDILVTLDITAGPIIHLVPTAFAHNVPAFGAPPPPDVVAVTNDGGGTLNGLTADVVGAPSWISSALDSDTAPTNLRIAYDLSGLAPGTYNAQVRVASAAAENTPQYVAVELECTGIVGCNFATVLARAQEESGLPIAQVTTEAAFADHIARQRSELLTACVAGGRDVEADDQTYVVAATINLARPMPQVQYVEARRIADGAWVRASVVDSTDADAALPPRLHLHGTLVELLNFVTEWQGIYDQILLYGAVLPVAGAVLTDDLAPNYFIAPLFCRCLWLAGATFLAEKAENIAQASATRRELAECRRLLLAQVRAQQRQVQSRFRG